MFDPDGLDLARMRRERHARLQAELARTSDGHLLLLGGSNVEYATGATALVADQSRSSYLRPIALVVAGDDFPHLFTPYPEGAPPELPADHLHAPLLVEVEEGVADLVDRLREVLGADLGGRLVLDELTGAMHALLPKLLAGVEVIDAGHVLGPARIVKTADELECVRRAQRINELAMYDVQATVRPGVRQTELSGLFLRRIFELGASGNSVDPVWQVMPPSLAEGPITTNHDVAYPTTTTDRFLSHGDVLWVDTGINYRGYASDFGRTWIVGRGPTAREQSQFERWRAVVDAVLERLKAGVTAGELTRVADEANDGKRPWLQHFYLAHGVGTNSAEMPLIGTDLGAAFDDGMVLASGMVVVLEPVIWDDGHAGYRSEEVVAVTDSGWVKLSDYPYTPYRA